MILFAESIDFGGDVVFMIVAIWWLITLTILLTFNCIFTFIGIKIARRKNKNISVLTNSDFIVKPYILSSIAPLIILTIGGWLAPNTLFLLPLFILVSLYIGYSQTIKKNE